MYARDYLVAERTLLGAVDSFLKSAVHVRPAVYRPFRGDFRSVDRSWLEAGGENMLEAVDRAWLQK